LLHARIVKKRLDVALIGSGADGQGTSEKSASSLFRRMPLPATAAILIAETKGRPNEKSVSLLRRRAGGL
jgi:hypothetical protein